MGTTTNTKTTTATTATTPMTTTTTIATTTATTNNTKAQSREPKQIENNLQGLDTGKPMKISPTAAPHAPRTTPLTREVPLKYLTQGCSCSTVTLSGPNAVR